MTKIDLSKENKNDYEISRYEGRIFCFNHFFFSAIAIPQKFFNFYSKETPNHYWLGSFFQASVQEGEKLYAKYIDNPESLRLDFYQYRDACRTCFDKLISQEKIDSQLYRAFVESIMDFGQVGSFNLEGLEKVLENKITSLISDSSLKEIITFPLYTSYAQKQNEALMEVLGKLDQDDLTLLAQEEKDLNHYKKLPDLLQTYRLEWGWALSNYNSEYLPTLNNLLELTMTALRNLEKEQATIKEHSEKRQQKEISLVDLSPEIRNVIQLLDVIIELREQRKTTWLKVSLDLKEWFRSITPIYSLSGDDLMWLTWEEQCQLADNRNDEFLKIIQARREGYAVFYGYNGERSIILTGPEAETAINFFLQQVRSDELKGITACPGKVIGKIRNINNSQDFHTFMEGDILASSHTTPDYVPIMKKAKAILTERGGITSHAAIVSRELKVPCIVGIKGLFNNFQDGETVEVDATEGIVKIIKN